MRKSKRKLSPTLIDNNISQITENNINMTQLTQENF